MHMHFNTSTVVYTLVFCNTSRGGIFAIYVTYIVKDSWLTHPIRQKKYFKEK